MIDFDFKNPITRMIISQYIEKADEKILSESLIFLMEVVRQIEDRLSKLRSVQNVEIQNP